MENYILVLFDLGLNTIVFIKLVESEDIWSEYKFLNKFLANQNRYFIETDLKYEYCDGVKRKTRAKYHFLQILHQNKTEI